jgi:hypothetical protein
MLCVCFDAYTRGTINFPAESDPNNILTLKCPKAF